MFGYIFHKLSSKNINWQPKPENNFRAQSECVNYSFSGYQALITVAVLILTFIVTAFGTFFITIWMNDVTQQTVHHNGDQWMCCLGKASHIAFIVKAQSCFISGIKAIKVREN